MGILDFFMGIQDPVPASYRITSCTKVATGSSVANCDMVGEVSATGMAPRVIEHNSPFTPTEKWPRPGDVLPVLVDRNNPDFMKVLWKDIPARTS